MTMNAKLATYNAEPNVTLFNGEPITTSVDIATYFHKRHDDVLRRIRAMPCSAEFNARNFAAVEYSDTKGEKRPCYRITRDGFTFLAMGFSGTRAAMFKEAYIDAFNRMAAQAGELQPHILITDRNIIPALPDPIPEKKKPVNPVTLKFHVPENSLKLGNNAISQLNALFKTVEYLNEDFWPKLKALFPNLGSEYKGAFDTAELLLRLLKKECTECEKLTQEAGKFS
jgi:Rha family phage regulatory protein